MADISVIKLPSGSEYNIKDAWARQAIEGLGNPTHFLGESTTVITDGGTQKPTISGAEVTPHGGDIVVYQNAEFIWSGTAWVELGDLSGLGSLAYKNSASGKVTPTGTISKPTFTGSSSTVTITATANTNGNYTPAGTVSKPTFTGSSMTSTGKFTPEGTVTVSTATTTNKTATVSAASSGDATYTPAGSVSLTKTNKTTTVAPASSGTATYTPGGTVGTPTISVKTAGATTSINNPTSKTVVTDMSVATPAATDATGELKYYEISGETLTLKKIVETTGASINTTATTVKTGDAAYQSSQPSWTGTGVRLVTGNISTADSASFTGTGARLVTGNIAVPNTYSATFTGTEGDVSVSGTTTGSVSQPTFSGTKVQISGTTTAAGSVSQPTFTGDEKTVTVS